MKIFLLLLIVPFSAFSCCGCREQVLFLQEQAIEQFYSIALMGKMEKDRDEQFRIFGKIQAYQDVLDMIENEN